MKVLLISDDKKNLEFLEKTLSENGCETIIYAGNKPGFLHYQCF